MGRALLLNTLSLRSNHISHNVKPLRRVQITLKVPKCLGSLLAKTQWAHVRVERVGCRFCFCWRAWIMSKHHAHVLCTLGHSQKQCRMVSTTPRQKTHVLLMLSAYLPLQSLTAIALCHMLQMKADSFLLRCVCHILPHLTSASVVSTWCHLVVCRLTGSSRLVTHPRARLGEKRHSVFKTKDLIGP